MVFDTVSLSLITKLVTYRLERVGGKLAGRPESKSCDQRSPAVDQLKFHRNQYYDQYSLMPPVWWDRVHTQQVREWLPNWGEQSVSVQRNLDKLEKWADRNHIKSARASVKSCIWEEITPCSSTGILPLYRTLTFGVLCSIWAPQYKKDIDILDQVQGIKDPRIKPPRALQSVTCRESLRDQACSAWRREGLKDLIVVYSFLIREYRENGVRLFFEECGDRTKGNGTSWNMENTD